MGRTINFSVYSIADRISDEMDAVTPDSDRVKALRAKQSADRKAANAAREAKYASVGTSADLNALDAQEAKFLLA